MKLTLGKAIELAAKHVRDHDVDGACTYGEPGYSDPVAGILFADWNDAPSWLRDGLERRGFELEWSDEWTIVHESGKAYRTSPDCYSWTPYYVHTEDGDVIGGDEIENGDEQDWYVNEYLLNDHKHCNVFRGVDLTKHGFEKYEPGNPQEYETGFHPGQNDKPQDVFKRIRKQYPQHDIVFQLDGTGQFDCRWSAWVRPQREDK
jgi:hypothetical protein